jgi:hypothetical protein
VNTTSVGSGLRHACGVVAPVGLLKSTKTRLAVPPPDDLTFAVQPGGQGERRDGGGHDRDESSRTTYDTLDVREAAADHDP